MTAAALQRLARTVLAAALLLALTAGIVIARHMPAPPVDVRPPPPPPIRLSPATIVVTAGESAAGATGTAPLPAAPPATAATDTGGITPARAFTLGSASAADRARALQCLTAAIYYEAAGEPDAGQRAVAQVILNRTRHPAFPATVCGVVYQGAEHAGCQFSFACDGAATRIPSRAGWTSAAHVAGAALAGYVYAPVGLATHYHSYAVTPAWNRGLVMTAAVGAHFFHRWKGYWGTAAAFTRAYRGGEPAAGPSLPATAPPVEQIAAPAITAPAMPPRDAVAPALADDTILPRWRDSGLPHWRDSGLPRWRDSGMPIDRH